LGRAFEDASNQRKLKLTQIKRNLESQLKHLNSQMKKGSGARKDYRYVNKDIVLRD